MHRIISRRFIFALSPPPPGSQRRHYAHTPAQAWFIHRITHRVCSRHAAFPVAGICAGPFAPAAPHLIRRRAHAAGFQPSRIAWPVRFPRFARHCVYRGNLLRICAAGRILLGLHFRAPRHNTHDNAFTAGRSARRQAHRAPPFGAPRISLAPALAPGLARFAAASLHAPGRATPPVSHYPPGSVSRAVHAISARHRIVAGAVRHCSLSNSNIYFQFPANSFPAVLIALPVSQLFIPPPHSFGHRRCATAGCFRSGNLPPFYYAPQHARHARVARSQLSAFAHLVVTSATPQATHISLIRGSRIFPPLAGTLRQHTHNVAALRIHR